MNIEDRIDELLSKKDLDFLKKLSLKQLAENHRTLSKLMNDMDILQNNVSQLSINNNVYNQILDNLNNVKKLLSQMEKEINRRTK